MTAHIFRDKKRNSQIKFRLIDDVCSVARKATNADVFPIKSHASSDVSDYCGDVYLWFDTKTGATGSVLFLITPKNADSDFYKAYVSFSGSTITVDASDLDSFDHVEKMNACFHRVGQAITNMIGFHQK